MATLGINFYATNINDTLRNDFHSAISYENADMNIQLLDTDISRLETRITNLKNNKDKTEEEKSIELADLNAKLEEKKASRSEFEQEKTDLAEVYNKVVSAMSEKNKVHFGNNNDVVRTVLRVLATWNNSKLVKYAIIPAFKDDTLYNALETIHVTSKAGENGNLVMSKEVKEAYKTASAQLETIIKTTFSLPFETPYTDKTRVKLTSVAGAYWRGNEKNKMLTRIYGISFPKKSMLDEYLVMMEEAKKRDHRKLGKDLELFCFSQRVGQGLPLWLPKGAALRDRLEQFLRGVQKEYGYQQVITPHIGNKELYVTSGHYAKYGKDSFQPIHTPIEGEEYLLKPMNCPHHCEIYRSKPRSYKELPVRLAEFGTVYRYEQSGELHGLTRVRGFTQDDAHLFVRPDQLLEEFERVIDIVLYIFKTLKFDNYTAQISLRDPNNKEKYIGSDENWEKAESAIMQAAREKGLTTVVELGEAAFYGPKLDFMVKDAIGRKWQLGTIQVDYNLPERFDLTYKGADDKLHRPIMIHRAPFGSMERFVAVLLEHTGGKFPLWLSPQQVVVLPISEKFNDYAQKVAEYLNRNDVRTEVDDRNEKIGRKIRDNELKRVPYLLIVGEKEEAEGLVSVRAQGEGDKGQMTMEAFRDLIAGLVKEEIDANKLEKK